MDEGQGQARGPGHVGAGPPLPQGAVRGPARVRKTRGAPGCMARSRRRPPPRRDLSRGQVHHREYRRPAGAGVRRQPRRSQVEGSVRLEVVAEDEVGTARTGSPHERCLEGHPG